MADQLPETDDHPPERLRSEAAHTLASATWLLIILGVVGLGGLGIWALQPSLGVLRDK